MLRVLNVVPTPALAVAVVGGAVAVTVIAVIAARRALPALRDGYEAEVSSQMLGVVGAMVGLLLAFAVIVEYESYRGAVDDSRDEAAHLAQIDQDSRAFAPSGRAPVGQAIGEYARAVVADEWPAMRDGRESRLAVRRLDTLVAAVERYEPRGRAEIAFYEDAVRQLNAVVAVRQSRLDHAEDELPGLLLALLVVGSLLMIGYAVLVGSRSLGFHLVGAVSVSAVVAFAFLLVVALAHPFSGGVSVDPDVFSGGSLQRFFRS